MPVPVCITLMCLMVVASTGAPLDEQQAAGREKRAKEIIGSSLSDDITRTKRIDPNIGASMNEPASDTEAVLDKKASIESETGPAKDMSEISPDVPTSESREQAVNDENEIIEKLFGIGQDDLEQARLEDTESENEVAEKREFKAEDMVEGEEGENTVASSAGDQIKEEIKEVASPEDGGNVVASLEDQMENKAAEEDSLPNISDEVSSGEGSVTENENEPYYESLDDLLYNYYDYPRYTWLEPDYRNKRSAPKRTERSLKHRAFTAEDMAGSQNNGRVKRDLQEDYIREILGYPVDRDEEQRELLGGLLEEALEEELAEEEAEREGYGYGDRSEEGTPTREEIEDTLQLLRYMYESIPGGEQEQEQERYRGGPYEEDFEEPYEEEPFEDNYVSKRGGMMEEDEFEPIVYNGEPGYFVPLSKRTFLSSVPGTRKRSFYPYMEEPYNSYSGLIGRSSMEEEKRNNMEYERLMRMAEALRDPDWEKKK